jgi:hypothetical protein
VGKIACVEKGRGWDFECKITFRVFTRQTLQDRTPENEFVGASDRDRRPLTPCRKSE